MLLFFNGKQPHNLPLSAGLATLLWCISVLPAGAAANKPPRAIASSVAAVEDQPKTVLLKGKDPEGQPLTYELTNQPAHGTVVLDGLATGGIQAMYTPAANYFNTPDTPDTFTFRVNDGATYSAPATVSITITNVNDAPVALPGNAVTPQNQKRDITLSGSDVDGDALEYVLPTNGQTSKGGTVVYKDGATVTYTPKTGYQGSDTFKFKVRDSQGSLSRAATFTIRVKNVPTPSPIGKLNDTGIMRCGNESSNALDCPQVTHPGQDAEAGRDSNPATNSHEDGYAGFSFTKISSTGAALPNDATEWACSRDNVTGLLWEIKTDDGGLHDKDWTYSWYNPDMNNNGGNTGTVNGGNCNGTSSCDTGSYVQAVNTEGLCGLNNWRMPTVNELLSTIRLDTHQAVMDPSVLGWLWSDAPLPGIDPFDANQGGSAFAVFGPNVSWKTQNTPYQVRLVSGMP